MTWHGCSSYKSSKVLVPEDISKKVFEPRKRSDEEAENIAPHVPHDISPEQDCSEDKGIKNNHLAEEAEQCVNNIFNRIINDMNSDGYGVHVIPNFKYTVVIDGKLSICEVDNLILLACKNDGKNKVCIIEVKSCKLEGDFKSPWCKTKNQMRKAERQLSVHAGNFEKKYALPASSVGKIIFCPYWPMEGGKVQTFLESRKKDYTYFLENEIDLESFEMVLEKLPPIKEINILSEKISESKSIRYAKKKLIYHLQIENFSSVYEAASKLIIDLVGNRSINPRDILVILDSRYKKGEQKLEIDKLNDCLSEYLNSNTLILEGVLGTTDLIDSKEDSTFFVSRVLDVQDRESKVVIAVLDTVLQDISRCFLDCLLYVTDNILQDVPESYALDSALINA